MSGMGKERLMWELEKFVVTRLRPFNEFTYLYNVPSAENRLQLMDAWWDWHEYRYRNSLGELVGFPQLTNHEICHEMFWNAFRGRSKMYIQIEDLRFDRDCKEGGDSFFRRLKDGGTVTLQCSLLTLQMLDYDIMMFQAMSNSEDEEYKKAAQRFYRPYLFSYVAEINRDQYDRLRELQKKAGEALPHERNESFPYLWLVCTFNPDIDAPNIGFDGYVVQSASSITKIRAQLHIIEDAKTPVKTVKDILAAYKLSVSCLKDDPSFIQAIVKKLGNDRLLTIDAYKIGNGNCIYAQGNSGSMGFFYDIGFHYRHQPQKIAPGVTYSYVDTMKKIYAQHPSFFILSHWDMDHIAGGIAARKDFLDKDWFAPDCCNACVDAQRFAKYLDMKSHLFLVEWPKTGSYSGRCIGKIDIKSTTTPSQMIATYRFYMGGTASCDRSRSNCQGIVIEYTDQITQKKVLMMGDVNYASFNKARATCGDLPFADTPIDYLIAPHHGSKHTAYEKITDGKTPIIKGMLAIICCTNEPSGDRPNKCHKKELVTRFNDNVRTTEDAPPKDQCIRIRLCPPQ